MPIRKYTTSWAAVTRVLTRRSTSKPEKSLLRPLKKTGGRNNYGRITVRFRGGGHKRKYRVIDFKRDKDGIPAKSPRSSTTSTAPASCCCTTDGEKRYILAPIGLEVGQTILSGPDAEPNPGNEMLRDIPIGVRCQREPSPAAAADVRSAGASRRSPPARASTRS